ncbi:hypothetical protein RSOLAG1IB_00010 [Rhizoctonia solani AG-1 IB]|uniref:Uncharacterized protein n=1 Tax=Thanatephorus cucumeris (strain AG1-IB / isolate 7/3/14) TaxID=1108050 RepID=A0A0B7F1U7_THACB|nr:hypothetical protein RSOLAG1IB_00010 [Rhizoctonia solani AG-1 IB]
MTPQPKPVVPQSFTFYQPSVPITLPKPIDELTREEIRAPIAKHSPPTSASSKRPVDCTQPNPDYDAPGPSKRQCKPTDESDAVMLPPTIAATILVGHGSATQQRPRRVACECWSFMTACKTKEPPVGISRAGLVATDIADLESRAFVYAGAPSPQHAFAVCYAALALPVYEALIDGLKNCLSESKFPELFHPIKCAVRKLEAYVEKARGLPVYTLAMAINPTLKFSWSDQQGPVQGQEARVMVKDSMYKVRCRLVAPLAVSGKQAPTHVASQAQGRGYARLLTVSKAINRASETTQNLRNSIQPKPSEPSPKPPSRQELTVMYMTDVEAELLRWEQYEWAGNDTMGTVNLVEFWKFLRPRPTCSLTRKCRYDSLFHRWARSVLPVSLGSPRFFSLLSTVTCCVVCRGVFRNCTRFLLCFLERFALFACSSYFPVE